jgi:uncharacterized protein YhaN
MTDDLPVLVEQYRAGLEAEMTLLHRLETLSVQQQESSTAADFDALNAVSEVRDRVMAGLVTIEHELRPIRMVLLQLRSELDAVPHFQDVAALHREAAALVEKIVTTDRQSLDALKRAEQARRFAAQALDHGRSTLAAYRRVVAPPLPGATLVDKKG